MPQITGRSLLLFELALAALAAHAQAPVNACDLAAPFGILDAADAQASVNMALGAAACTAGINGDRVCDATAVQRVWNAVSGGECKLGPSHSVSLAWNASDSPNVAGYNIYRRAGPEEPFSRINQTPVAPLSFLDTAVIDGQTYRYVATAVDADGNESAYSNEASASVPARTITVAPARLSGDPGTEAPVSILLRQAPEGVPSTLLWSMVAPEGASVASVAAGPAADGMLLKCSPLPASSCTCILAGYNRTTIGGGAIATIGVRLPADFGPGMQLILKDLSASAPDGTSFIVSGGLPRFPTRLPLVIRR
jgi:hypothetical protein